MTIEIPLRFVWSERPVRPAVAWLIPGDDPTVWLDELVACGVRLESVALLRLARADGRGGTLGALAIPPPGKSPRFSLRCVAYGEVAPSVYLPCDALLDPAPTAQEWSDLAPTENARQVWTPALGWLAFEPDQIFRGVDLIGRPTRRETLWDVARPGVACNSRLWSIEPDQPLELSDALGAMKGDIGDRGDKWSELPRHPDEPSTLGKWGQGIASALAQGARGFARSMRNLFRDARGAIGAGQGMKSPGWLESLQAWADRQLQRASDALQLERNKELARLLRMLEDDPEQGLKYALPMTGDDAWRGTAAPGSRLVPQSLSLNFNGGRGGVDSWDTGEYRQKLIDRYRKLASAELAAGRYHRAAYIHAKLLGDYWAAAAALEKGGYWREAAAIYEQKANRIDQAARCLESGGHWSEAIALYQRLNNYEKIGDLHRRLEDEPAARAAYLQAIERCRGAGDWTGAARLWETKLADAERALDDLFVGGFESNQAQHCLAEGFRLAARLGKHDRAIAQGKSIAVAAAPNSSTFGATALSKAVETYPDPSTREELARVARKLAATGLAFGRDGDRKALADSLARLAPADKLLEADCRRFVAQRDRRVPAKKMERLARLRSFALPRDVDWRAAVASRRLWHAAGWAGNRLVVVRGDWEGRIQQALDPWRCEPFGGPIYLAACPQGIRPTLVHPLGQSPVVGRREFPDVDDWDRGGAVEADPAFSPGTLVAQYGPFGRLVVVDLAASDGRMRIFERGATFGDFTGASRTLFDRPADPTEGLPRLAVSAAGLVFAIGSRLIALPEGRPGHSRPYEFDQPIVALTMGRHGARPPCAVTFEHGAAVFAQAIEPTYAWPCATDVVMPQAAFVGASLVTAGENLVVVDRLDVVAKTEATIAAADVYQTRTTGADVRPNHFADAPGPGELMLAVLPGYEPNVFGVLTASGEMTVWSVRV